MNETKQNEQHPKLSVLEAFKKYRVSYLTLWSFPLVLYAGGLISGASGHSIFPIFAFVFLGLFFLSSRPYFRKELTLLESHLLSTIIPFGVWVIAVITGAMIMLIASLWSQ